MSVTTTEMYHCNLGVTVCLDSIPMLQHLDAQEAMIMNWTEYMDIS